MIETISQKLQDIGYSDAHPAYTWSSATLILINRNSVSEFNYFSSSFFNRATYFFVTLYLNMA